MSLTFCKLKRVRKTLMCFFASLKKLKIKNQIFCKLQKLKNMNLIFCELKRAQKYKL
eukprot:UN15830